MSILDFQAWIYGLKSDHYKKQFYRGLDKVQSDLKDSIENVRSRKNSYTDTGVMVAAKKIAPDKSEIESDVATAIKKNKDLFGKFALPKQPFRAELNAAVQAGVNRRLWLF